MNARTGQLVDFDRIFAALTGHPPFPWQAALYDRFMSASPDNIPATCNLPTGLGKTNVIAVWLVALANQMERRAVTLPRRLVYVVNRRTVVDQTTNEVEKLRTNLAKKPELSGMRDALRQLCAVDAHADGKPVTPLAISTLRGQFADNREWSADPSRPAVICGTVDMIGSRLLFSGYGVGFKSKPLHAGFLGQDALLVHDEAHLEPAFQQLLMDIEKEQERERARNGEVPWPRLRIMELTTTSRSGGARFPNDAERTANEANPIVRQRILAKKSLNLQPNKDAKKLAEEIADLVAKHQDAGHAVLVFVRKVEDVERVVKKLPVGSAEQLTGTLRGLERDGLVKKPIFQRFLPLSNRDVGVVPAQGTVFLVCTSAGEVGIDISADQMVCDLSTFESMVQRFGRVNRFGDRDDTVIDVVHPKEIDLDETDPLDARRKKTLKLLNELKGDASPATLGRLDAQARIDAFAPPPTILPATDILFDAWALTTIRQKMPGRPEVAPYLHGLEEEASAETHIAWRQEVWELSRKYDKDEQRELESFATDLLEDYPIKPHELLRDNTYRKSSGVRDRLIALAKAKDGHEALPVWIQQPDGEVTVTTLGQVAESGLAGRTVILPPEAGGLGIVGGKATGIFDGSPYQPDFKDEYDVADHWLDEEGQLRKRTWNNDQAPPGMRLEREIAFFDGDNEDEPSRVWRWYVRRAEAPSARSGHAYPLVKHLEEAKAIARAMVTALHLPADLADAIAIAAQCHDLGKRRKVWQNSIGNSAYPKETWAKSGSRAAAGDRRTDYRHEFGSLLDARQSPDFLKLSPDQQDLVLHLIAAHHGRARPHFPMAEAFDLEREHGLNPEEEAAQTPRRFARLQRRYGRWGLAYLESLVRAADIQASQMAEQAKGGSS